METQKGLTLIEVIVIIAIVVMLWAILMPRIGMDPKIARRVVCGTNLKGFGNAVTVYANDFDGQYPYQGMGTAHNWADWTDNWFNPEKDWSKEGTITVGSSLYLLVRLADVSPRAFVCPKSKQEEFKWEDPKNPNKVDPWELGDLVKLWDFGHDPYKHVSYAMHKPYGKYPADDTNNSRTWPVLRHSIHLLHSQNKLQSPRVL